MLWLVSLKPYRLRWWPTVIQPPLPLGSCGCWPCSNDSAIVDRAFWWVSIHCLFRNFKKTKQKETKQNKNPSPVFIFWCKFIWTIGRLGFNEKSESFWLVLTWNFAAVFYHFSVWFILLFILSFFFFEFDFHQFRLLNCLFCSGMFSVWGLHQFGVTTDWFQLVWSEGLTNLLFYFLKFILAWNWLEIYRVFFVTGFWFSPILSYDWSFGFRSIYGVRNVDFIWLIW